MRLRSWRGSTELSTSTKKPFPWARIALIVIAVAILAYLFVPGLFFIQADALVQGQLVPVTPIYRVRIDRLFVACDDRVTTGQKLATVSNFLVQANYQRQYQQSVAALDLSHAGLDEGVAAARENAANLLEKYRASALAASRLGETFHSYNDAYYGGGIARVDWLAKKTEWQSAQELAASDRDAWQRAEQQIGRIGIDESSKIASDQTLADQAKGLAQRVGSEPLLAPVSGYIVNCVDRPQNVVNPSTPVFDIFEPQRAYVLAYFDPNAIEKIHLGQSAEISIAGVSHRLTGRVGAIYPDLSKLPPQLTRFFWQHVQWSEYRPVRIFLDRISPSDRAQLYYDAQAHVRIRIRK